MSIKKKMAFSTTLLVALFMSVILTGWTGYQILTRNSAISSSFEKQAMYLEMLFRGLNEGLLTNNTAESLKITERAVRGFEEALDEVSTTGDPMLRQKITEDIEPRWRAISAEVPAFTELNQSVAMDPVMMARYGELLFTGERLSAEVRSTAERLKLQSEVSGRRTRLVMALAVAVILIAVTALQAELYGSVAVPINRLRRIISEVSKPGSDGIEGGGVMKRFTGKEVRTLGRVADIHALVEAFDTLIENVNTHIAERRKVEGELERLATTDKLTGAFNRTKFEEVMRREQDRARRYLKPLSMILLDIDHFKRVNDRHGHMTGDRVLKEISEILRGEIRDTDYLVRWGGEEFMLIAPETDLESSTVLAERIRQAIEAHDFGRVGAVTVSMGISGFRAGDMEDDLLARADEALYAAKANGRNRVEVSWNEGRLVSGGA